MAGLEELEGSNLDAIFLEDGATESSNAIQTGAVSLNLAASQGDGADASPDAIQTSTGAGDVCIEVSTSQEEAPVSLLPRTLKFIRNILADLQRNRQRVSIYDAMEIAIMGDGGRNSGLTETLISAAAQPAEEATNDTSDVSTGDFNSSREVSGSFEVATSDASDAGNTTLEVEVEDSTGIEGEEEGDATNNNDLGPEAHLAQPGDLWATGDDLFPHLDSLGSQLTFLGVFPEAFRVIYHHHRCFLHPALFRALHVSLACVLPHLDDKPNRSIWVSYAISLVLSSHAEVGFHQAVVGVYLRKRYGRDMSSNRSRSSNDVSAAALRCAGSTLAAQIVTALASFAALTGFRFLLFLFPLHAMALPPATQGVVTDTAGTVYLAQYLVLALLAGALPCDLITTNVYSKFLFVQPASALTNVWGFRALARSYELHRAAGGPTGGGVWIFVLFSFLLFRILPRLVTGQFEQLFREKPDNSYFLAAMIVWVWMLSLVWLPIRTLFYLKLRASHARKQRESQDFSGWLEAWNLGFFLVLISFVGALYHRYGNFEHPGYFTGAFIPMLSSI